MHVRLGIIADEKLKYQSGGLDADQYYGEGSTGDERRRGIRMSELRCSTQIGVRELAYLDT